MNANNLITNYIIMAGSAYLFWKSFDKSRTRERWAKLAFAVCGVIGILCGVVVMAWLNGRFALGKNDAIQLERYLSFGRGLVIGLLLSLIFSGQLMGAKRTNQEIQDASSSPK